MKIKKVFMVVVAAMLLAFLCAGLGGVALARKKLLGPNRRKRSRPISRALPNSL